MSYDVYRYLGIHFRHVYERGLFSGGVVIMITTNSTICGFGSLEFFGQRRHFFDKLNKFSMQRKWVHSARVLQNSFMSYSTAADVVKGPSKQVEFCNQMAKHGMCIRMTKRALR